MTGNATVILIDDERGMLTALTRLLEAEDFSVKSYLSVADYLAARQAEEVSCLVLDVSLPGIDGMEFQSQLREQGDSIPIVFLTGHGDIPMSVVAIKSGAVDFLTKPVNDIDLLQAVRTALDLAQSRGTARVTNASLRARLTSLTPREYEVMKHVITGKPNKMIASDLGIGEQTIKIHRMRLMGKMGASSLVELLDVSARLGVTKVE